MNGLLDMLKKDLPSLLVCVLATGGILLVGSFVLGFIVGRWL